MRYLKVFLMLVLFAGLASCASKNGSNSAVDYRNLPPLSGVKAENYYPIPAGGNHNNSKVVSTEQLTLPPSV